MSDKLKNKQMPVSCRMFLRYLKEANLFKEFCQEAEIRLIKDNEDGIFPVEANIKFHTFSDKWLWYVRNGKLNLFTSQCPINSILDYSILWTDTRRGHDFWSKVSSDWKTIFRKYHSERKLNCSFKGTKMTDDVSVFAKILKDYLAGTSPIHSLTIEF